MTGLWNANEAIVGGGEGGTAAAEDEHGFMFMFFFLAIHAGSAHFGRYSGSFVLFQFSSVDATSNTSSS